MNLAFHERVRITGRLRLEWRQARSGGLYHLVLVDEGPNLVVTAGLGLWVERMTGGAANPLSHIGFGDDGSTTNSGMTALVAEKFRIALTSTQKTASTFTLRGFVSENQGNGYTVREVGAFNSSTPGVPSMWARRAVPSANQIAKDASKTITVIWEFAAAGAEL